MNPINIIPTINREKHPSHEYSLLELRGWRL